MNTVNYIFTYIFRTHVLGHDTLVIMVIDKHWLSFSFNGLFNRAELYGVCSRVVLSLSTTDTNLVMIY